MTGDGPLPAELLEVDLCEKFGWTLDELDGQDESRVLPGVRAAVLRSRLENVRAFLETQGRMKATDRDLEVWKWAHEVAESESPDP